MDICIRSTVVSIPFIKNDPRIDTVSSTLNFGILMVLFNYRCKDSSLKVPVLEGIFSKHPFNMWISKLSNAFIASLYINDLELYSSSNQALLKCSSFSIIFSFVGVAFSLFFPKSLFSRKIKRKSSLYYFKKNFRIRVFR